MGLIMLVESVIYETSSSVMTADFGGVSSYISIFRKGTFTTLLIGSLATILIGALGTCCNCKTCKNNSCCWAVFYGSVLFFLWMIFLVVGSLITGLSAAGPKHIEGFCNGEGMASQLSFLTDTIEYVDGTLNNQTNVNMCSRICPCDVDKMSEWTALSESELNAFNRTKQAPPASQSVTKNSNGMTYLISANSASTTTYSKFTDCIENLEALAAASGSTENESEEESGNSETALKVISFFESKYTCSGVCSKALFFFTLDMDQGVPK